MAAPREPFSRVRRYLSYKATAKWCALLASVALSFLYVALIAVLGLFADLVVERGQVRGLEGKDPEEFRKWLNNEETAVGVNPDLQVYREEFRNWLTNDVLGPDRPNEVKELIERSSDGIGMVSLAWRVRHEASRRHLEDRWNLYYELSAQVLTLPVRWIPWTRDNWTYLACLFLTAIFLALVRGFLALIMHFTAAVAVIEATTRLRRAVAWRGRPPPK